MWALANEKSCNLICFRKINDQFVKITTKDSVKFIEAFQNWVVFSMFISGMTSGKDGTVEGIQVILVSP